MLLIGCQIVCQKIHMAEIGAPTLAYSQDL